MAYEPFKCPDCSVWWRGETHKCASVPTKEKLIPTKGWLMCPKCSKNVTKYDWHSCSHYPDWRKEKGNRKHNDPPAYS